MQPRILFDRSKKKSRYKNKNCLMYFARYNINENANLFSVLIACCYDLSRQLLIGVELLVYLDERCELPCI